MKSIPSFSLTDLHFMSECMGCNSGPVLITRKFFLPFYQNKVAHKREKKVTLTYQLIEAIISTEARKKNTFKKKEKSSHVSFRELFLCVSLSFHCK